MSNAWVTVPTIALMLTSVVWVGWWLMAAMLQRSRKARFATEMAAYCRKIRPVVPGGEPKSEDESSSQPPAQVTVSELLERAIQEGRAIRLNWAEEDLDETGRVRPYVQDQFPTTVLPRVCGDE
jgi:hypothetical protein